MGIHSSLLLLGLVIRKYRLVLGLPMKIFFEDYDITINNKAITEVIYSFIERVYIIKFFVFFII
ncbi:Uncharacterised protein [Pasteurella multocida]|nr:Uncharacterised protein [Pasteurella multocida]